MPEASVISKTYNPIAVAKTKQEPKEGNKQSLCAEGTPTLSSSGGNLMCPKSGRILILSGPQVPKVKSVP